MTMPLDAVLARRLAGGNAVEVTREPHIGTGISKTALVDWGKLSARQIAAQKPDAVVVFIGANEGFPMGRATTAATRPGRPSTPIARGVMMNTYRRNGASARVLARAARRRAIPGASRSRARSMCGVLTRHLTSNAAQ